MIRMRATTPPPMYIVHLPYTGSGTSCLQDGSTVPPDDSANPHIRSCEPSWRAVRSVAVVLFISSESANASLILRSASPASSVMS